MYENLDKDVEDIICSGVVEYVWGPKHLIENNLNEFKCSLDQNEVDF